MQEKHVNAIINAKKAHLEWVRKARMLTQGLEFSKESIPVESTRCGFGLWFYDNVEKFSAIETLRPILREIESTHTTLHDEYRFIYDIYFPKEEKKGFFQKLFAKEEPLSVERKEKAKEHLVSLESISKDLSKQLDTFAKQIRMLDGEAINKISLITA